jgi:enoyl-CoA hydratase/carnithine racemase
VDFETIAYSVEDRVATIAFNRPDQLNAINLRMKNELGQAFAAAEADEDVWLIIVTGNGRAFCAGADVNEIPEDGGNIYESRTCPPTSSGRRRRRPRRRSAR